MQSLRAAGECACEGTAALTFPLHCMVSNLNENNQNVKRNRVLACNDIVGQTPLMRACRVLGSPRMFARKKVILANGYSSRTAVEMTTRKYGYGGGVGASWCANLVSAPHPRCILACAFRPNAKI